MYKTIDLETWNRAHLFESYKGTDFPYINIGCNLDITELYKYVKHEKISLYFSMIYLATKAADDIQNFKYRFVGNHIFEIDRNTAFATHMNPGDEVFTMVECDHYEDMKTFAMKNRQKGNISLPDSGLSQLSGRMDILNFTCMPWISYTHFVRTIARAGKDCNPKISMGKFFYEGDRILLPFSSQTHHGLMDGAHVGKYFMRIEELLKEI